MPHKISLSLAGLLISCSAVFCHPGHDRAANLRLWKVADGRVEIEASFVLAKDEYVQLHKHDGELVWIPLTKLSTGDRDWVQNRLCEIRRLNMVTEPGAWSEEPTAAWIPVPTVTVAGGFAACVAVCVPLVLILRHCNPARVVAAILTTTVGSLTVIAATSAPDENRNVPAIQKHFEPFKEKLKFRSDDNYFFVESNGMPDHRMMVGITAWQQQVPIPQAYTGRNAWQIPLHPTMADKPVSAKKELFRGAIALAVNGVPIFNPIKNDGRTDTYLAGELDEFGGHCGRADDYHYHVGPVHLEKVVGRGNPIGYALDGYPLYGYLDAEGKEPKNLDEFNGRTEKDGYRYYSTKKYPYINGGLRGVVTVKDDQIDPQPRANSPRPALMPLRGAKITDFIRDDEKKSITVKYDLKGQTHSVKYTANVDGNYTFVFTDGNGKDTTEVFRSRGDGRRPPPKKDRAPKKDEPPLTKPADNFKLTSPAFEAGGKYPAEFTGDGDGVSPPLKWSGAPEGTKFYALQLWHKPKGEADEVKSYWVITNIPANVTSLDKNSRGVGKDGYHDKKRTGYDPMNSKGPGPKEYHITMYALSAEPKFLTDKVTRSELLKAIKGITLAETTLSYTYERKAK